MRHPWRARLVALGFLALAIVCAVKVGRAQPTMQIGENWLGPAGGNTAQQDLAAYGGTIYRTYYQDPLEDGEPNRIRLMRYQPGQARTMDCGGVQSPYLQTNGPPHCPAQITQAVAAMAAKGLWWEAGNETNNQDQDGRLTTDADALVYAEWLHAIVPAIKAGDPTARILGPAVIGWDMYCCEPWLSPGRVAYDRLINSYQQLYGTLPPIDVLTLHFYPQTVDLPPAALVLNTQVEMASAYAAAHGWGFAVTEFGHWAYNWDAGCSPFGQSETDRYNYTRDALHSIANHGGLMALYYGNKQQVCDGNGHASYLLEADGSLTPEGRAFRDFAGAQPPVPTATPIPTPTRIATPPPTATPVTEPQACVWQVVLEWEGEVPTIASYTAC